MQDKKILKYMSVKFFKCHLIILFVSLLFTAIFPNLIASGVPALVYAYYGFLAIGYLFLLYTEAVIGARRDFYNANGDLTQVDRFLCFKAGLFGQIPTFVLLLTVAVFYAFDADFAMGVEMVAYCWMIHFWGFLPNMGTNLAAELLAYLGWSLFPCVVCGVSYIMGIRQCKTKEEAEQNKQ